MDPERYFYFGVILFLSGAVLPLILFQKVKGYPYILPAPGLLSLAVTGIHALSGNTADISSIPVSYSFRGTIK